MDSKEIRRLMGRYWNNIPGWRTSRRIVVFESDDWGSIRMPSRKIYQELLNGGVTLSRNGALPFNLYDSLETSKDLEFLFDALASVKDKNNNFCVFTPNILCANPDFEKIKASNFQEYFWEPVTSTFGRTPGCERSALLWKHGIERKLFIPQSHGREHLCVTAWMQALRAGDPHTIQAFGYGVWGISTLSCKTSNKTFQAAFDYWDPHELKYQEGVIAEGLRAFELIIGYKASLFVPPNFIFNNQLMSTLFAQGVRYISLPVIQREPRGGGRTKKIRHFLGQKDKSSLIFITRNCSFEPSTQIGKDWVSSCLKDIQVAFHLNKPAIIASHRVNYVGSMDPANRDKGLNQLRLLLKRIYRKWPDVEFMTSAQLGDLISENDQQKL